MAELFVHLCGRMRVLTDDQREIPLAQARARELLAYLLVHPRRSHHREVLCDRLWGDRSLDHRKTLRQSLWHLTRALGPVIDTTEGFVQLDPSAGELVADIGRLHHAHERSLGRDTVLTAELVDELLEASSLCSDELLEGWYSDWCLVARRHLRTRWIEVTTKLAAHFEAVDEVALGLEMGRRVLDHEPASELTHQRQMRLYVAGGDRTGALRQFEACCAALETEFGLAPCPQTQELASAVRAGAMVTGLVAHR